MAELRLSRRALADLRSIERHIAARHPAGASRVIASIERSLSFLAESPLLGRPEADGSARLLVEPRYRYLIFYRVEGDEVRVLYVLHPRRDRGGR